MSRDLLTSAADEVETAREAIPDSDTRDRLDVLADHLRSQADREATPALGVLDRILVKLREIQHHTTHPAATEAIDRARDDVLAFLETLDDRGMKQHGGTQTDTTNGSA